ncbi:hypothetical protein QWY16_12460 [Planococcus shenhongbingii]|uniref:Uncharacterized protein n=1 Tax=Planococcus shenhongbingii TaxID=3058398 RepID=A0ABT8N8B6_9BACL|nr:MULTISPECIES: hypothetical protein [unclassified Planococcus (in: firmicutes)]MDN7244134.1 hypothetical protein [Planococcus sp. N017]WKA57311.1 hypothetical protein QWY16_12460 [Planococcus sp. N016]
MKTFQVEFYFDQGNTIVLSVQATDKEAALGKIPSNGTYDVIDEASGKIYRITINLVKYIVVNAS